ncbi:MAG: amidohydrolase family protein [Marinifilaceae bacterium]
MNIRLVFVLVLFFLSVALTGQSKNILLKNGNVVNVKSGEILRQTDILIANEKIINVGKSIRYNKRNTHIVDLTNKYVIPGLIDAHVHMGNDPNEEYGSNKLNCDYMLRHGITSVRDGGGDARILKKLKDSIDAGIYVGPNIYYSAFLGGSSYFKDNDRESIMTKDWPSQYAPWMQQILPESNLDSVMTVIKQWGITGIKIYGGFDYAMVEKMVNCANKHGLETWGHATLMPAKPSEMAKAGVKVLSHAYLLEWEQIDELKDDMMACYGLYYNKLNHEDLHMDSFIALMKKNDLIFDPTLYLCKQNGMDWSFEVVRKLNAAGVRICAGTDYINDVSRNNPYLIDELGIYVNNCGLTLLQALQAATINGADVLGLSKQKGVIKKGYDADLVVLDDNPLKTLEALSKINTVIKGGIILEAK